MNKGFWAVVALIVVIFGGILFFKGGNKTDAPGVANQPTNHVEGLGQKNVTLIEYGDYQCPVCGAYYPVVKEVVTKYTADIKFQFRNLPITQLHQNAFAAARAAEAAGLQNKFWEMHDLLFANQLSWSSDSNPQKLFNQYAGQLKINVDKFKKDFASSQVNSLINADVAAFNKTGNEIATPTFLLNGKKIQPTLSYKEDNRTLDVPASVAIFSKLIDEEIAKQATQPVETPTTQQPTE